MKRFIELDGLSKGKQKIKFCEKCIKTLEEGAKEAFIESFKYHEKLEKYYISAMNFEQNKRIEDKIISSIFDKND